MRMMVTAKKCKREELCDDGWTLEIHLPGTIKYFCVKDNRGLNTSAQYREVCTYLGQFSVWSRPDFRIYFQK